MDDRELSSQVCYMNLDDFLPEDQNPRLCIRCKAVLAALEEVYANDDPESKQICTSNQSLHVTAVAGCPLCRHYLKHMSPDDLKFVADIQSRGLSDEMKVVYSVSQSTELGWQLVIRQEYHSSKLVPDFDDWRSSQSWISGIPAEDFDGVNENHLGDTTDSKCALEIICKWLKNCVENHTSCQRIGQFLPTRLLCIGPDCTTARLVQGKDLPVGTEYLTLSHCWGDKVPFRLLQDNLRSMEDSIQIPHLPKTFRDAMMMTLNIGKSYLWIDSLCIVQDDLNDWRQESALMDRVYSESYCNLSAAAARTSSDGLFFTRNPLPMKDIKVTLNVNGMLENYFLLHDNYWENAVEQAILNSRGWVLQERILSPCNIQFASTELFWECKELCASECFPRGFPDQVMAPVGSGTKQDICFQQPSESDHFTPISFTIWDSIVEKFSRTNLTFERDKLVAIEGLARAFSEAIVPDQYLAGLWRRDLPIALTWYCNQPVVSHREYTAPSWSWASLDGEVGFEPHFDFVPIVQVIDAQIELVGPSPFGQVRRGCLTIKGSLVSGIVRKPAFDGPYFVEICDTPNATVEEPEHLQLNAIYWDAPTQDGNFNSALNSLGINENSKLYLLPLHRSTSKDQKYYDGILLWPTGSQKGEFRRIAYFRGSQALNTKEHMFDKAMRSFDSKAAESGLQYEEAEDGTMKYTITII